MRIGIIGAGNIGSNLARRLTQLGHDVTIANSRGPETLAELTAETGARAVTADEAAAGADLVIVTIPEKNVPALGAAALASLPADVPVVDTGNYYPQHRDGRIAEIEDGLTESEWVASQLGRPVVKAFNNIYAANLLSKPRPADDPARLALPVAGDGPQKDVVLRLVDELGFDAVDAGPLSESWRQQPGTPVYGAELDADGVRAALAAASPERLPDFRAA